MNIRLNKADQEIIDILKETFRAKKANELIDPDELTREWILKVTLALSILAVAVCVVAAALGQDTSTPIMMASGPIGLFFGLLFMHINNKSENTSIIIFALTWFSMMLGFWF